MAQWLLNGTAELFSGTSIVTSPNRTNDAFRVARAAAQGYVYVEDGFNLLANQFYTFTLFVKRETANSIILRVGKDLNTTYVETAFSLTNGNVVAGPVNEGTLRLTSSSIQDVGDDWFVIQTGFFTDTTGSFDAYITSKVGTSETLLGTDTGPSSFFMWNAQLEQRRLRVEPSYLGSSNDFRLSIPEVTFTILPVWRAETSSVTYNNVFTGALETIDVAGSSLVDVNDFNTIDAVEYVQVPSNPNHGFPNSITINDNRGGSRVVNISRQERYEKRIPVQITFLNKEGVLEDLWSIRRSTEMLNTTADTYYRNTINYDTLTYNTGAHTMQRYNVVNRKSIRVSTDFLPEAYNNFFEQLYNSEYVWLTYGNTRAPVILKNSNFQYKTHVNDKLVQYDLEFEYSNRLDNTIR